jgi:uncharacterized membrane protein
MNEKRIHRIFAVSVSLKGLHAIMEVIGGIALYLTSTATIVRWIDRFSEGELIENPNDWIANRAMEFGQHSSVEKHHFYASIC